MSTLPLNDLLAGIPWDTLTGAYETVTELPAQVKALLSDDPEARENALGYLDTELLHQGTVYEPTARAIPALLWVLQQPEFKSRAELMTLLRRFSSGTGMVTTHSQLPVFRDFYLLSHSEDDLEREIAQEKLTLELLRDHLRSGTGLFIRSLNDPEESVRLDAVHLLHALQAPDQAAIPALRDRVTTDQSFAVRASALSALAELSGPQEAPFVETVFNETTDPLFRLAAADCWLIWEKSPPTAVQSWIDGLLTGDIGNLAMKAFEAGVRSPYRVLSATTVQKGSDAAARLLPSYLTHCEESTGFEDSRTFGLLLLAFPNGQATLTTLTDLQKRAVRYAAQTVWPRDDVSYSMDILKHFGLPTEKQEMQSLVGVWKNLPSAL